MISGISPLTTISPLQWKIDGCHVPKECRATSLNKWEYPKQERWLKGGKNQSFLLFLRAALPISFILLAFWWDVCLGKGFYMFERTEFKGKVSLEAGLILWLEQSLWWSRSCIDIKKPRTCIFLYLCGFKTVVLRILTFCTTLLIL